MCFEIIVSSMDPEGKLPSELDMDLITSAAYFGEKDIDIEHRENTSRFSFKKH